MDLGKQLRDLLSQMSEKDLKAVEQKQKKLEEHIKQYELLNNIRLSEREHHIYTAAYWMGKLDAKIEQEVTKIK